MLRAFSLLVLLFAAAQAQAQSKRVVVAAKPAQRMPAVIVAKPVQRLPGAVGPQGDALDEVNAARARRGLRPYVRDDNLTQGAMRVASYRAARLMAGHTYSDFAVGGVSGVNTAAGCAAWAPSWGWGSCCTYDNYSYAGAALAYGSDGRRYMHLFVRK